MRTYGTCCAGRLALLVLSLAALLAGPAGAEAASARRTAGKISEKERKLGERMYREGILPSGKPMQAVAKGDSLVDGTAFTCVSCHQRAGLGSVEGRITTPPTNGRVLYKPQYMVYMGAKVTGAPPIRPAYTDGSLAYAMRFGVDPAGRVFHETMPRYVLGDKDMAILIAYLKWLSSDYSPGVTATTVRFATVITEETGAEERRAMLSPLEQFIRSANAAGGAHASDEEDGAAVKRLTLSTWVLKGPPATWHAQLEEHYRREPVFALLGGISTKEWRPVHEFSEQHQVPCLFPVTDLPVVSETDWYTLYFSKGLYQEGESVARYLNAREGTPGSGSVLQLVRTSPEGQALSAGFGGTWQELGRPAPDTATLKTDERLSSTRVRRLIEAAKPAVLIVWDGPGALTELRSLWSGGHKPAMIFLSSSYAGSGVWSVDDELRDAVHITYPFRLSDGRTRQKFGAPLQPLRSSPTVTGPVPGEGMITSKKMVVAVKVLSGALLSMKGHYYRDHLLDVVGMGGSMGMGATADEETYPLYQRLSLGPGQRYVSQGCYIVQLSKGPEPYVIRKNDWVTY